MAATNNTQRRIKPSNGENMSVTLGMVHLNSSLWLVGGIVLYIKEAQEHCK